MDNEIDKRHGDPDMGAGTPAAATPAVPQVQLTVGGTDAGPASGPNPAIGTPHTPALIVPPPVIHNAGDERPGDANAAVALTDPSGMPVGDTADFLAAREAAEEALAQPVNVPLPGTESVPLDAVPSGPGSTGSAQYADETADVGLAREQGGRDTAPAGASSPGDFLYAPHPDVALGPAGASLDAADARIEIKEEANTRLRQQAASQSGLDSERNDYERQEFGQGQMDEVRDDVLVGAVAGLGRVPGPARAVHATFPTFDSARAAVAALRDIGIAAADIDWPGAGAGNGPAADSAPAPDEGATTRIARPADAEIYSDFARSDADYRTGAAEGAAQTGAQGAVGSPPPAADSAGGDVHLTVHTDQLTHAAVVRVLRGNGADDVH